MKNKIGKILCFSPLLMIGGNKVLSMEEPKYGEKEPKEKEIGPKEESKEKEGGPKEKSKEEVVDPKEKSKEEVVDPKDGEGNGDGSQQPPQQPQQGGGNSEDFETLKKEVDQIEKNTHPESEKITLVQFCSGQN